MLYLNQNDYGHVPYMHNTDAGGAPPERRNVGTSGCGLCCTCMAVEHLTVQTLPLEECVRMSEESGANHRAGTDMVILGPLVAERFGLEYRWTTDMQEMLDCLHGGGQVVVNVRAEADGTGIFTNTRHYVLAVGADTRRPACCASTSRLSAAARSCCTGKPAARPRIICSSANNAASFCARRTSAKIILPKNIFNTKI